MTVVTTRIDFPQLPCHCPVTYLCPMFSKTFGHAVRTITYVAMHGVKGEKVALQTLARELDLPQPYLGKVMQDLVRHGIIDSSKGPNGGFYANAGTLDTVLVDILKITDGSLVFELCALGLKRCNAQHPCLLHHDFAVCRDGMLKVLAHKTIQELVQQTEDLRVFLV